jgi:SAM-dependent methyltransferase
MANGTPPAHLDNAYLITELQVDTTNHDSRLDNTNSSTISTSVSADNTTTSFREDHGRRYHAFSENQYWLPNDATEISRLNIQHHCWRLSLGGRLFLAPIKADITHAVDIGTGTGEWAKEFAVQFQGAEVVGTDLSAVPSARKEKPGNCKWEVANAEEEWRFEGKVDYVHSRMLLLGIHDWPRYFQQAFTNLKPGGWVEVQEPLFPTVFVEDGGVTWDSPFARWGVHMSEAAAVDGIDTQIPKRFDVLMEEAGFVNVATREVVWPVGTWVKGEREKALGYWTHENVKLFFDGAKLLFLKRLGWDLERVEKLLKDAEEDIEKKGSHYYWRL